MRTNHAQVVFVLGSFALLATGIYVAFTSSWSLPTRDWLEAYPLAAVGLATVAGFVDGVNPCAITTLLLFIGALLTVVERASHEDEGLRAWLRVWTVAGSYILGIFLLYFTLGLGFIEATSLHGLNLHVVTRVAGLLAVFLGLVMTSEYFLPNSPIKLTMPAALHGLAHRWGRQTTVGAAFVAGVLIGLCTIPCGGAMYLAVAAIIGGLSSKAYAYTLLTTYNVAFVMPLVLLVSVAGSRSVLQKMSRLHISHRGLVKLVLGIFVILVGLFALL
jgi:cytochrome c-type biogenesis protein